MLKIELTWFSNNGSLHDLYKSLPPVRLVSEFLQKFSAPNVTESATECSILQTENALCPFEGMCLFLVNISFLTIMNCLNWCLLKFVELAVTSTFAEPDQVAKTLRIFHESLTNRPVLILSCRRVHVIRYSVEFHCDKNFADSTFSSVAHVFVRRTRRACSRSISDRALLRKPLFWLFFHTFYWIVSHLV